MSSKTKTTGLKEDGNPALTPKLRFPEFREAEGWEQKDVGDVFRVTRGEVLSMRLVQESRTNEMPYPVYSSQTKNNGLSGYYSDFLFEDAITWTTDGANAGDVNFRTGKFFCTNVCGVLLNTDGFANPCIAALINSVSRKYVSYVGNPKLMNGVMSKIGIPFPSDAEQQKIAECLSSVGEVIAAQARKLDALKTHKKGLMQQLFPGTPTSSSAGNGNADGDVGAPRETQPRLRFPEFQEAGKWDEHPLKNVFSIFQGFAFSSNDSVGEGVRWLKIADVSIQKMNHNAESYLPIQYKVKFSKFSVTEGDYVIALTRPILSRKLKIAQVDQVFDGALLNQRVGKLVTTQYISFVYFLLQTSKIISDIEESISGTEPPNLSPKKLEDLKTYVPGRPEQQRIADCLSSLDDIIAAQARKLDVLKTHKKGLMQQLFPSPKEVEA